MRKYSQNAEKKTDTHIKTTKINDSFVKRIRKMVILLLGGTKKKF